jgi:hypothetical protein
MLVHLLARGNREEKGITLLVERICGKIEA